MQNPFYALLEGVETSDELRDYLDAGEHWDALLADLNTAKNSLAVAQDQWNECWGTSLQAPSHLALLDAQATVYRAQQALDRATPDWEQIEREWTDLEWEEERDRIARSRAIGRYREQVYDGLSGRAAGEW